MTGAKTWLTSLLLSHLLALTNLCLTARYSATRVIAAGA